MNEKIIYEDNKIVVKFEGDIGFLYQKGKVLSALRTSKIVSYIELFVFFAAAIVCAYQLLIINVYKTDLYLRCTINILVMIICYVMNNHSKMAISRYHYVYDKMEHLSQLVDWLSGDSMLEILETNDGLLLIINKQGKFQEFFMTCKKHDITLNEKNILTIGPRGNVFRRLIKEANNK